MLLGVLLAIGLAWQMLTPHKSLAISDVVKVELRPKGAQSVSELSTADAKQVVEWFNQAGTIVDNSHHGAPGCGTYSALLLHLKSGDVVTIDSYMRVTRGKPGSGLDELSADYYFKQPNLEQYLREWDAKADGKGC
jgi:hypothetical protein